MRPKLLFPLLISCYMSNSTFAQSLSGSVFFKTDSFSVSSPENIKLQAFIKSLDSLPISKVMVKAYCDDIGKDSYNQTLSIKRADAIKRLLSKAMPAIEVQSEGKGELALTGKTDTESERSNNRRVDMTVFYIVKQKAIMEKVVTEQAPVEKKKIVEKPLEILSDNQKVGDKITLNRILFIGGRHTLLPESYEALEALRDILLEKKKYHILILGHICCVDDGNDGIDFDTGASNLSVARARAVYNYLIQQGVNPNRLSYKGMKALYPTGRSDREDRRVEIEITKIDEK